MKPVLLNNAQVYSHLRLWFGIRYTCYCFVLSSRKQESCLSPSHVISFLLQLSHHQRVREKMKENKIPDTTKIVNVTFFSSGNLFSFAICIGLLVFYTTCHENCVPYTCMIIYFRREILFFVRALDVTLSTEKANRYYVDQCTNAVIKLT